MRKFLEGEKDVFLGSKTSAFPKRLATGEHKRLGSVVLTQILRDLNGGWLYVSEERERRGPDGD